MGGVIYLNQVTKYCRAGKEYFRAVDDVSLAIESGEFVAVLGPSGSGKSVLLRLIGGILRPSEGSVLVQGERLQDLKNKELTRLQRRNLGFVSQPLEFSGKTALEAVLQPLKPFKVVGDKATYGKSILKKVGLEGKEDNRLEELSMGELQRLAVARAIITQPKIILADEPVNSLDEEGREDIFNLFLDLNEDGKTIVMATQSPEIASAAKRVIHMNKGKIEGTELPGKTEEKEREESEEEERIVTEIN